jgi:alpha-glycerophosphate oxidase/glycerol-3-phosphate dehydrogenase
MAILLKRELQLSKLKGQTFQVAIVGGGINGAVSAAVLSAAGVKVALIDKGDFAGLTSQESSNMVWGGIKYLQTYELPLVWNLCGSRNHLLKAFPNRIKPISFLAGIGPFAPFGKILGFLGTSLYWILGRFKTKPPKVYSIEETLEIENIISQTGLKGAIRYDDALLIDNDARFVWDFVKNAIDHGTTASNYVSMLDANKENTLWKLDLKDELTNDNFEIFAEVVINAGGPFGKDLTNKFHNQTVHQLALSKGIHLVVPKLTTNNRVLAFFDEGGRLFYVIPMQDRSVIGTTDTRVDAAVSEVTEADRDFVLEQANRCLNLPNPLTKADIISERCGVRPLVVKGKKDVSSIEWTALSRKHEIEVNKKSKIISIFGGKLTDCVNVGEEIVAEVKKLGIKTHKIKKWYGEDDTNIYPEFKDSFKQINGVSESDLDFVAPAIWRRHGKESFELLNLFKNDKTNLERIFPELDLTVGEAIHILNSEMIIRPEDLWRRRTSLALLRTKEEFLANPLIQRINSLI